MGSIRVIESPLTICSAVPWYERISGVGASPAPSIVGVIALIVEAHTALACVLILLRILIRVTPIAVIGISTTVTIARILVVLHETIATGSLPLLLLSSVAHHADDAEGAQGRTTTHHHHPEKHACRLGLRLHLLIVFAHIVVI